MRIHKWPLLATLYLCVTASALPQTRDYGQKNSSGGELRPEQAAYDVGHYRLDLKVDPEQKRIDGTLTMTAELVAVSDELVMDLDQRLDVGVVTLRGGTPDSRSAGTVVRTKHEGGALYIPLEGVEVGETVTVTVEYGGVPREAPRPPWDGGFTWSRTKDGQHWIATTCQGEGADVWWPCKDHPSDEPDTMDLHITVPAPLVVAANGRHMGTRDAEPGWMTYHWHISTPINNYGVALNIAPYETVSTEFESIAGDKFEFTFWVLPENLEKGRALFPEFVRQMEFFEDVCGPYPFRADKYGVAETPHLGMEHQSIIGYGNGYRGDIVTGYDYDWLHHHELSHEWWGNLVTASDWSDFWIHEGIGTYMQALYLERRFGAEAYRKKLATDLARVVNKGIVAPRGARATQDMYFASRREDSPDIDVYMKGSWICHSLRWLMGDEPFFKTLRRWAYPDPAMEARTDGSACRFATTEELLAIAEEVSGMELDWFFELYLRQPALPLLIVEREENKCLLRWRTPRELPFPMPVEVQIDGQCRRVEMPDGRGEILLEPGAELVLDPLHRVLMVREG